MNIGFAKWWQDEGRLLDPDTEDVPWFDKRKALAEMAWNAATLESEQMARAAQPAAPPLPAPLISRDLRT